MKTAKFCNLPDAVMMSLVQSDAAQAEELEIFLGLLRWGQTRFGGELLLSC